MVAPDPLCSPAAVLTQDHLNQQPLLTTLLHRTLRDRGREWQWSLGSADLLKRWGGWTEGHRGPLPCTWQGSAHLHHGDVLLRRGGLDLAGHLDDRPHQARHILVHPVVGPVQVGGGRRADLLGLKLPTQKSVIFPSSSRWRHITATQLGRVFKRDQSRSLKGSCLRGHASVRG